MKKLIMTVALFLGLATTAQADEVEMLNCSLANGSEAQIILTEDLAYMNGGAYKWWFVETDKGVPLVVIDIPQLNSRIGFHTGDGELVAMDMATREITRIGWCGLIQGTSL